MVKMGLMECRASQVLRELLVQLARKVRSVLGWTARKGLRVFLSQEFPDPLALKDLKVPLARLALLVLPSMETKVLKECRYPDPLDRLAEVAALEL